MTQVTEQLPLVEISTITARAHDWMQTKPGSEPWFTAIAALQFALETDYSQKAQQEYQGLLATLLADKIPSADAAYEGTLLGENQQASLALAVGMLAEQNAATLSYSSLSHFAGRVVQARFYAGAPIDETALVPAQPTPTYEAQLDAVCYPAGRELPPRPVQHAVTVPETHKETSSWQKVFKLGPLAISFALQPKHA